MKSIFIRVRGFNLIEAAIVLGVVGLVIGGIWVAASAVQKKMKDTETVSGILQIARRTQALISRTNVEQIGTAAGTTYVDITSSLISAKIFPDNWINGSTVNHPYGGLLDLQIGNSSDKIFGVHLYTLDKASCIAVVTGISSASAAADGSTDSSGAGNKTAARYIGVSGSGSGSYYTFPVTPAQADTSCAATGNTVWIAFNTVLR